MPGSIDFIVQNSSAIVSLLGVLTLHGFRSTFDRAKDHLDPFKECLASIRSNHSAGIVELLEKDAHRFFPNEILARSSPDDIARKEKLRNIEIEEQLNKIWKEANRSSLPQKDFSAFRKWERWGRRTCELGRFLSMIVLVAFIGANFLGITGWTVEQWVSAGLVLFIVPFLFALVCWLVTSSLEGKTENFIDSTNQILLVNRRTHGQ